MEQRESPGQVGTVASVSGNASTPADPYEYPDPTKYNLSDASQRLLFMQQYQIAQQHDPQANLAVLAFFLIMVNIERPQMSKLHFSTSGEQHMISDVCL
jgi:hypothetical protein